MVGWFAGQVTGLLLVVVVPLAVVVWLKQRTPTHDGVEVMLTVLDVKQPSPVHGVVVETADEVVQSMPSVQGDDVVVLWQSAPAGQVVVVVLWQSVPVHGVVVPELMLELVVQPGPVQGVVVRDVLVETLQLAPVHGLLLVPELVELSQLAPVQGLLLVPEVVLLHTLAGRRAPCAAPGLALRLRASGGTAGRGPSCRAPRCRPSWSGRHPGATRMATAASATVDAAVREGGTAGAAAGRSEERDAEEGGEGDGAHPASLRRVRAEAQPMLSRHSPAQTRRGRARRGSVRAPGERPDPFHDAVAP